MNESESQTRGILCHRELSGDKSYSFFLCIKIVFLIDAAETQDKNHRPIAAAHFSSSVISEKKVCLGLSIAADIRFAKGRL